MYNIDMNSIHDVAIRHRIVMVKMPFKKPIPPVKNAVEINKIIDSGAPVKQDVLDEKKHASVNVRFPPSLLRDIDDIVSESVGISRSGWILQTLQKEVKRVQKSRDDE